MPGDLYQINVIVNPGTPEDVLVNVTDVYSTIDRRSIAFNSGAAIITITSIPAAAQFVFGNRLITLCDLAGFTQCRLQARILGVTAPTPAVLRVRYKLPPFSDVVTNYITLGTSEVEVPLQTSGTLQTSGWINLDAAARVDGVFISLESFGGNGVASPTIGQTTIEFRR